MKQLKKAMEKWGAFLVGIFGLGQPGKGNARLVQELIVLSEEKRTAVRSYYVRKMVLVTAVLVIGAAVSLAAAFIFRSGTETIVEYLNRPGYGEGDRKEELTVQIEGESQKKVLEVTVQEQKYTKSEKIQMLNQAVEQLEELLPGENESLDEVRSSLVFPQSLESGAVTISWMTVPYGIIDDNGNLLGPEDENGTLVEIQGTLTCAGEEAYYSVCAKVFPPKLSEQEQLYQSIKKEVELADAQESHQNSLQLPEQVDEKNLVWSRVSDNPAWSLLAVTGLAVVFVYLQMDQEVHKKAEMRKNRLLLEYPDFMWKMTMLLGAGMSIKSAFTRISNEYLREKEEVSRNAPRKKREIRYVYEEITYTCYEMQSGIPEAKAYERFGRRCQLPEYIRIGNVLSQNLKKGARGLTALLEKEAEVSLNDRKNHARKIGERVGTKLLMPMVLMLTVVLAVLMVPAFLSF